MPTIEIVMKAITSQLPAPSVLFKSTVVHALAGYLLIFCATAWSSGWTPEWILKGDIWPFLTTRMIVPMALLAVIAAWATLIPSAALLTALIALAGAISTIKKEAIGQPFTLSDVQLAGQGIDLWPYMTLTAWVIAGALPIFVLLYFRKLRFRFWSPLLFVGAVCVLSSYRIESVVAFLEENGRTLGVHNILWSEIKNEHVNGVPTYLYFMSKALRFESYSKESMNSALTALSTKGKSPIGATKQLDVYIILGESWWNSPADPEPPLSRLRKGGFVEGIAISPVYGGGTPNAELEVLTAIPMSSFRGSIIPYQHYISYISEEARTLPRLFKENDYTPRAFHNYKRSFWLRHRVYPKFGFESFDAIENMRTIVPSKSWPSDDLLFEKILGRKHNDGHRFSFLATVATHGPFDQTTTCNIPNALGYCDYRKRLSASVDALLAFERELRRQGRAFLLLAFGDHLPALVAHQQAIGLSEKDRVRVPFFVATSGEGEVELRDKLNERPLYCFGPTLIDWLQIPSNDRYFSYVAERCRNNIDPGLRLASQIVYHQLFAPRELQSLARASDISFRSNGLKTAQ